MRRHFKMYVDTATFHWEVNWICQSLRNTIQLHECSMYCNDLLL